MKTILLWDPRFPDRRPARLTLEDSVAAAAVRSGVATAANPLEAGILSAGGPLDPTMLTEVIIQHGYANATRRVFLPYSVVMVGALAGVMAEIGTPIAGGVTPTPTPGSFTPLAVATRRPVATGTRQTFVNSHGSDGTNLFGKYRKRHRVFDGWDCSGGVEITFPNRCSEAAGFNDIAVSARLEYPAGSGTWYPVTFGPTAAASVTITSQAQDAVGQVAVPAMTAGTYFYLETSVSVASAGQKWPTLDGLSLRTANGEGSALSTTAIGGAPPNLDTDEFYGATSITGLSKAPYAIVLVGDSIQNGGSDDRTLDHQGYTARAIGPVLPYLVIDTSGELGETYVNTHEKRMAVADRAGITHAAIAYMTNDVFSGKTLANLQATFNSIVGFSTRRNWRVAGFPILTRVNGNRTTPGTQTPFTNYEVGGQVDQLNAYIAGPLPGVDVFIDTRPGWQDAANKILTAGGDHAVDETHPNALGYAGIVTGSRLLASTTLVVQPRKAYAFEGLAGLVGDFDATDGAVFRDGIGGVQTRWANKIVGGGDLAVPSQVTATVVRQLSQRNDFAGAIFGRGGAAATNSVMAARASDPVSQMLAGSNRDFAFVAAFDVTATAAATVIGWSSPVDASNVDQCGIVWRSGTASSFRYGRTGEAGLDIPIGTLAATLFVIGVRHSASKTTVWVNSATTKTVTDVTQAPANAFTAPLFSIGNLQGAAAVNPWAVTGLGGKFYRSLLFTTPPGDADMGQAITDLAARVGRALS